MSVALQQIWYYIIKYSMISCFYGVQVALSLSFNHLRTGITMPAERRGYSRTGNQCIQPQPPWRKMNRGYSASVRDLVSGAKGVRATICFKKWLHQLMKAQFTFAIK